MIVEHVHVHLVYRVYEKEHYLHANVSSDNTNDNDWIVGLPKSYYYDILGFLKLIM